MRDALDRGGCSGEMLLFPNADEVDGFLDAGAVLCALVPAACAGWMWEGNDEPPIFFF